MTPLRIRFLVFAFAVLATAISYNALYLQDAARLAGSAISTPAELLKSQPGAETAALPRQGPAPAGRNNHASLADAGPAPPRTAVERARAPVSGRLVTAIQRELRQRGYDPGPVNGELGLETRSAIIAYEFDEAMPLRGEPTEALLKSLIFGAALGKAGPGPPARFERHGELIAEVQTMLADLGYGSGPIDGRLDAGTREAIRKFESDRDLDARGRISARLLLEMVIVTGRPFAATRQPLGTG
jgi:peptidoglycan hydrolase-like protein with peptidoglycan-binding domain